MSGLAAIVAMECGWVVTEEGRQPWVVYGLQTTAQAATTNGGVLASLSIIIVVYGVIGVATIAILLMLARRWRRDDRDDAPVPYGPPPALGTSPQPAGVVMAAAVGAILLASVTLYAVLGGADFGGGLWDLLAGTTARGRAPRDLIDESITPVWEANHVWLVFDLVIFWTAFPHAFASVMTTLALPIWLARRRDRAARGRVRLPQGDHPARPAARGRRGVRVLLAADPVLHGHGGRRHRHRGRPRQRQPRQPGRLDQPDRAADRVPVRRRLRLPRRGLPGRRGRTARRPAPCAPTSPAAPRPPPSWPGPCRWRPWPTCRAPNPALYDRLTGRALPLVVLAGVCGLAVLALLTAGRTKGIRAIAALGVAAVIWGWGVAQYPVLLPGTAVTLTNAGATQATFVALVVVAIAAVILVVPSFALLYTPAGPPHARRR